MLVFRIFFTKTYDHFCAICVKELLTKSFGKSTNDNGFGMFRTVLAYKLAERGKQLIKIDKWFPSSKMCRFCGCVNRDLKLSDRVWTCECGAILNRDENAAINIMNVGLSMV